MSLGVAPYVNPFFPASPLYKTHCMQKRYLLCLFIALPLASLAQHNLSGSRRTSVYTYIYKISNAEAISLVNTDMRYVGEKHLHTLVDSFLKEEPVLLPGNYLWVYAQDNKLEIEHKTIGDVEYKLINNDRDLAIALHTKHGQFIRNAKVYINNRNVPYNEATQSYRLNKFKRKGLIKVYHEGVVYLFPLEKNRNRGRYFFARLVRRFPLKYITRLIQSFKPKYSSYDYFRNRTPYENKFRGFVAFSKPMYKPGDTVKLKAFITDRKGRPVNKPLLLRITDNAYVIDTILATIKPYRRGGYEWSFVLNDSLDIDLDDEYLITLEELRSRKYDILDYDGDLDEDEYLKKRKVLMRGKFTYEEYELKATNFSVRADKKDHYRGTPEIIYLKATDENDMAVMDGRTEIVIKPANNENRSFHDGYVFLPDTLWKHEQALDPVGETKIVIPDSIFPRVDFNYEIHCTFLNSNNEYRSQTLYQYFYDQKQTIEFKQQKDSLYIQLSEGGKSIPAKATVTAYNAADDSLLQLPLQLPGSILVNPFFSSYEVETDSTWDFFELKHSGYMVTCLASRTKDSISVQVMNPNALSFWYTIFAGNKPIASGYGDSLLFIDRTTTAKNYFVSLQYIYGNKAFTNNYTVPYRDKLLNIQVNQPEFVYPGQTTIVDITVTDPNGKPAANADVTAYAFTKKFEDADIPGVPYFGKYYPNRKGYANFYPKSEKEREASIWLNWRKWSREMGLDSIEYFRFLHPKTLYVNREPAKDSITQIAPFVVIHGDLQPVHQVYIDEVPIFFSQAQQLQRYSFKVTPGKHSLKLRTPTQLIKVDSVWAEKGMKTFLSVRGDTTEYWSISSKKMKNRLTEYEKNLWSRYMILMEKKYAENMTYITSDNYTYLLDPKSIYRYNYNVLTGPLTSTYNEFVVKNKIRQPFEREGNYLYNIEQGLIKQKQLPYDRYTFQPYLSYELPSYNFSDFVLTEKEIDSLWNNYLYERSSNEDLFSYRNMSSPGNGLLQINVGKDTADKPVLVKNIFLFRYNDPDFVRIYKGKATNLGYLPPQTYRLFLLMKDDSYFIKDSIRIQPNGVNYYSTGTIIPLRKDSTSIRISSVVNNREKINIQKEGIEIYALDSIRQTFNTAYLDLASFNRVIYGRVTDEKNTPLPGVTVYVKGTNVSTVTDVDGYYRLNVPDNGTLQFSYVGFETMERRLGNEDNYDAKLHAMSLSLNEVVVVGYGTTKKRELTGSFVKVSSENILQGQAAGLYIRGASTLAAADKSPLVVIDGLPYSGRLEDLDESMIGSIITLSAEAASGIWGARAGNGVIVITTKSASSAATINEDIAPLPGNTIRKNFKDDAFWQPKLVTNAEGKTSFRVTYPDDITNWRTFFIAMGNNRATGYKESSVKSYKLLSAGISIPQFAVIDDSMNIIGKTLNYGLDTVEVKRSFTIDKKTIRENTITLTNSRIDTFMVAIPSQDSIQFGYTAQKADGYFDGEERSIPVFKTGVLETTGFFAALGKDTSFSISFKQPVQEVKIYAEASVLPVLLDEIEKLRTYEYLCNEQLASKLKAMLLKKKVYSYLGKPFKEEKNIEELINNLNQKKSKGSLWGWWNSTDPEPWISQHVIEALQLAEKEGYKTNLNKQYAIDYLVYIINNYSVTGKINIIYLLQLLDSKANAVKYITELEKQKPVLSLYETLRLLEVKQLAEMPVKLDTLLRKQSHTMFGNLYWGEDNYRFFDNSIHNTVLMYKLLKREGGHDDALQKIRQYFLEKRKDGKWRNTYESSLILETILPDLLHKDSVVRPASIVINNGTPVTSFPYSTTLQSANNISISKQGTMPVYFTAYEQHWNTTPEKVESDFVVKSSFEKNGQSIDILKAGEPVVMRIKVTVKADADYVMVEAPIPAGCSYHDKRQGYTNNEVHREHFKNKVSIFCNSLKKGDYEFVVSLLPRYTGSYHLNPAKAEMMYFPVFYGREGMKKVRVQ